MMPLPESRLAEIRARVAGHAYGAEFRGDVRDLLAHAKALAAEVDRLRAALEEIGTYATCRGVDGEVLDSRDLARRALKGE